MMFGLDKAKISQPHRQHKHKSKFTRDRDSLKEDKQIANRASRRKAHMAVHKHEEPEIEPKNSVKWNHW